MMHNILLWKILLNITSFRESVPFSTEMIQDIMSQRDIQLDKLIREVSTIKDAQFESFKLSFIWGKMTDRAWEIAP